jgi:hypothetical protein
MQRQGKTIAPLARARIPQRFTDAATVDKWYQAQLQRRCSAAFAPQQEKGDVLQYLMSLK